MKKNLFQMFNEFSNTPQYAKSRKLIAEMMKVGINTTEPVSLNHFASSLNISKKSLNELIAGTKNADLSLYPKAMDYVKSLINKNTISKSINDDIFKNIDNNIIDFKNNSSKIEWGEIQHVK